jgi:DNA-binding NarL/FixJ family response regulator
MSQTKSAAQTAKVLVVDDHPMIRDGIKALLEAQPDFTVVGEAGTVHEARKLAQDLRPDLILLDLYLPDGDSLGLLEEVRSWAEPPKVLVLTSHNDQDDIAAQALRLGAGGFVNKAVFGEQLLKIVRDVLAGKTYLSPELIERLVRQRNR